MAKNKEFEIDFGFDYFCFSINSELGILNQGITSSCTCRLNSILLKSYYLFLQSIKANLWQFNVSEPSISLIFTLTFKTPSWALPEEVTPPPTPDVLCTWSHF